MVTSIGKVYKVKDGLNEMLVKVADINDDGIHCFTTPAIEGNFILKPHISFIEASVDETQMLNRAELLSSCGLIYGEFSVGDIVSYNNYKTDTLGYYAEIAEIEDDTLILSDGKSIYAKDVTLVTPRNQRYDE